MRCPSCLTSTEWIQSGGDSAGYGGPFLLTHQGMETVMVIGLVLDMGLVLFLECPYHLPRVGTAGWRWCQQWGSNWLQGSYPTWPLQNGDSGYGAGAWQPWRMGTV